MRRRGLAIAGTVVGLVLLLGWLLPEGVDALGHRQLQQVQQADSLDQRLDAAARAQGWFSLLRASPPWAAEADKRERRVQAAVDAAFEEQRRTLRWGSDGVDAHLDWLKARIGQPPKDQDRRARLHHLVATTSYGRADLALEARPDDEPLATTWRATAALWEGRTDVLDQLGNPDLPPALGLLTGRKGIPVAAAADPNAADAVDSGAADPNAADPNIADPNIIVTAEALRRSGDIDGARHLLAPHLRPDDPLAPLAAQSWSLCLLDELSVEQPGLAVAEVGSPGPDPRAQAALQALLLLSPSGDPAWTGAWLGLSELQHRTGQADAGHRSAWGAVDASLATWAAEPDQLPALTRLDAPGAVHPERVQRVRVALDEARLAAPAGSDDRRALTDGVVALFLVQARAQLIARQLRSAQGLLDRARRLAPDAPPVIAWSAWTAVLDSRPDDARALLDALPASPEGDAVRAAVTSWLDPAPVTRVDQPARALRARLRAPWSPGEPLAFADTHRDRPDELWLALASPPIDAADPVQALPQAWLMVRVADHLDATAVADDARAWAQRQAELVLDQPLWALFGAGVFTVRAPPPVQPEAAARTEAAGRAEG